MIFFKRGNDIISKEELHMLYREVIKHTYRYKDRCWKPAFWNNALPYLRKIVNHHNPAVYIYTIATELENIHRGVAWRADGKEENGNIIAFQLYVILYYKYKGDPEYEIVLTELERAMDVYRDLFDMNTVNALLDQLKSKQGMQKTGEAVIEDVEPLQFSPASKKGRPSGTLKEKMIDDEDGSKLEKLHKLIEGKKGRDAALVILACMEKGWMTRPTFTQLKKELGVVGSQQAFNKYLDRHRFSSEELEGIMQNLS